MSAAPNKATKADKDLCRIITPEFRVSYPHVFKANTVKPGDKPKYSITMLFPKDSDLMGVGPDGKPRNLKDVIRNAKIAKFGPKENWPEDLASPVSDGDDPKHHRKGEKEGYRGHWVVKAQSNEDQRPTVVGPDADQYGKLVQLTDPASFYPGCYARAYIYAYAWEYMGREGIGFILDHVQKTREGKSFGGKKSVDQIFSPIASQALSDSDDSSDESEMDFK